MEQPDNQNGYLSALQEQIETLYEDDITKTVEEQHMESDRFLPGNFDNKCLWGDALAFGTDKDKKKSIW